LGHGLSIQKSSSNHSIFSEIFTLSLENILRFFANTSAKASIGGIVRIGLIGRVALLLLISLVCICVRGYAQTGVATVTGEITDQSGRLVPGVTVLFTNLNTNVPYSTKTNGQGVYVLSALPPGIYRANLMKEGFMSIVKPEIELHTQDSVSLNFALQVGSVSETVTVSASAEQMPTDNPAVGLLVNRDFIENMPLNGRSFQDLIALAPGVVSSAGSPTDSQIGLFSVNGQRGDANYFAVDGVAANTNPSVATALGGDLRGLAGVFPGQTAQGTTQSLISVDSLQEFKIQTSGYSAEYGRQPGGQVEFTSRAGTNDLHGSLFDYFRNEALDANSEINKALGIAKQQERQNDFGGTLGGPLVIPRLYHGKDKTFFFVSYEGLRLKLPEFASIVVPTEAFRQFVSPGWQPFLNAAPLPSPNLPNNGDECAVSQGQTFACTGNFAVGYSNPSTINSTSVRVDQIIDARWQVFARYAKTPSQVTGYNQCGAGCGLPTSTTSQNTSTFTLGTTGRLSDQLTTEVRFNWTAADGSGTTTPNSIGGGVPYPRSLLDPPQDIPAGTTAAGGAGYCVTASGSTECLGSPNYSEFRSNVGQYNILGNLVWVRGTHEFKFGADFRILHSLFSNFGYEVFLFGASAASLQQGIGDQVQILTGEPGLPVFKNLSLYAQDQWRVSSRLTLDYGLRWEFNPAPGASDGKYPLALTSSNLATAELATPGTPQYQTKYDKFAPRVGFAYLLDSSPRAPVVVRGGFGIFYDTGQSLGAAGYVGYPFYSITTLTNLSVPLDPSLIAPPSFNVPLTPPYGQLSLNDPALTLPYTEEWNLSVSKGLTARNVLTASYLGNGGKHLLVTQAFSNLGAINPLFTTLNYTSSKAFSAYEAFQLQDQGTMARGLQVIASFTWAHGIDNAPTDNPYTESGTGGLLRENSANDVRLVFNTALHYDIPGQVPNRFVRVLTKGWSLDERFTAQTGYPIDIFQGYYTVNAGGIFSTIYPDLVPGVPIVLRNVAGDAFGWALNPAAFSPVPLNPDGSPVRQGNLEPNYVHGPGFWNWNSAIQRRFPLTENLNLIFRVDAFNILNHPNAPAPDQCLCDGSSFGKIGFGEVATSGVPNQLYAAGAARSLQIALKLQF
jgi:hypothetical protein